MHISIITFKISLICITHHKDYLCIKFSEVLMHYNISKVRNSCVCVTLRGEVFLPLISFSTSELYKI